MAIEEHNQNAHGSTCSPTPAAVPAKDYLFESPLSNAGLYIAYALAAWNWRSLEFSIAPLLVSIHPNSFVMVSLYGFLDSLARLLAGSFVGSYIDRCTSQHSRSGVPNQLMMSLILMPLIRAACAGLSRDFPCC